jgi:branched-chain amino acid transport system substrate-binding protein
MQIRRLAPIAVGLAVVLAATACSSSTSDTKSTGTGGGTSSAAAGATLKLGLLTDSSGPFSSGFTTSEKGIKAYVQKVNDAGGVNGHMLSYVVGDSTSTVPGALTAAQKLVQVDHVFAVIDDSSVFLGAAPFLTKQGIPAFGGAFDGPEWNVPTNTNLFATTGTTDLNAVNDATGRFMKAQGVTSCGSIGYPNPTSAAAAVGVVKSCVAAGLKNGYLNTQVPTGSTDVGPIAIAMKNNNVDGISLPVVPSTGFALVAALKQLGVKLKVVLLATGYGGDLLESSAAVSAGQGFMFSSVGQPVEANTPATKVFVAALAKVGVTTTPTFAEQESYIGTAGFVAALKAAGDNATQQSVIAAGRKITNFDADGLLAPGSVDFSNFSQIAEGAGAAGCIFAASLSGKVFTPVPGTPLCGKAVPGVTIK